MFVPIGHDRDTLRRLPVVSFSLIALTITTFFITDAGRMLTLRDDRVDDLGWQVLEHLYDHPWVDVDPAVLDTQFIGSSRLESFLERRETKPVPPPAKPEERAGAQTEMNRLTSSLIRQYRDMPAIQWGFMPRSFTARGLLGHMFLHAGWFHLLGNLLILYLAGPFLEDVWGRPFFLFFYLGSGVAGALLYASAASAPELPMVGASGAVAGLMGAFLLRYSTTKIRFVYVWGFLAGGAVSVSAWIVLSLWFAQQFLLAVFSGENEGGVAYLAHVGGFAWGVAVALAIRLMDIEKRIIEPGIVKKIHRTVVAKPGIDRALEIRAAGDPESALRLLSRIVALRPGDRDAALAYWSVAVDLSRQEEAAPAMLRLVRAELRTGNVHLAVAHWREMSSRLPELSLEPADVVSLGRALVEKRCFRDARAVLRPLVENPTSELTPLLALTVARIMRERGPDVALLAIDRVLSSPNLKREVREEAGRLRAELPVPQVVDTP